jgi:hypothetical protein
MIAIIILDSSRSRRPFKQRPVTIPTKDYMADNLIGRLPKEGWNTP